MKIFWKLMRQAVKRKFVAVTGWMYLQQPIALHDLLLLCDGSVFVSLQFTIA